MTTRTEYHQAVSRLQAAAKAYYDTDGVGVLMSDADYDQLIAFAGAYEQKHGLTGGVAAMIAAGAVSGSVEHSSPMLSLDNVFSGDELRVWSGRAAALSGSGLFCVEPKMDGLAVSVRYEDGCPVQMVTRGDGRRGEDVSFAIDSVVNLPRDAHNLFRGHLRNGFFGEVRGEVIFTRDQFDTAQRQRAAHGDPLFANPRNGAAGALRGAARRAYRIEMSFVAYDDADGGTGEGEGTYTAVMGRLADLGFTTAGQVGADAGVPAGGTATADTVAEAVALIGAARDRLAFQIDGAVVKVDSYRARGRAGAGSRAPRWAVAYKFPAQEVTSTLVAVHWQVGRTGVITPRAEIVPVQLAGSCVTFATLHNVADLQRKGFMLGDRVLVQKAGDVIPRLEAPLPGLREGSESMIVPPKVCPQCAGPIDRSQERWRCAAGRACGAAAGLAYAVSRDVLDIDGLGRTLIGRLVASGTFTDVASLFEAGVDVDRLVAGGGVAPANAAKIAAQVQAAKGAPFARVLCALGIRGTGRSASAALAAKYVTMARLQAATVDDVAGTVVSVNRLGAAKAGQIVAELAGLAGVIGRLAAAGVNLGGADQGAEAPAADDVLPLAGLAVCVTGTMVSRSRTAMNELVATLGGRPAGSVSKSTAILVAGPGAGSKLAKAAGLGVRVMSETEFCAEFGGGR